MRLLGFQTCPNLPGVSTVRVSLTTGTGVQHIGQRRVITRQVQQRDACLMNSTSSQTHSIMLVYAPAPGQSEVEFRPPIMSKTRSPGSLVYVDFGDLMSYADRAYRRNPVGDRWHRDHWMDETPKTRLPREVPTMGLRSWKGRKGWRCLPPKAMTCPGKFPLVRANLEAIERRSCTLHSRAKKIPRGLCGIAAYRGTTHSKIFRFKINPPLN